MIIPHILESYSRPIYYREREISLGSGDKWVTCSSLHTGYLRLNLGMNI